jgi:3-oxoacyl-[acyl-carrier protein] reductase
MELKGRVALVTGAAVRLGRAIALELASAGASVAVHYRGSADAAAAVVQSIRQAGGDADSFPLDLGDIAALPRLVDSVLARFGRLDALVNNAAIFPRTPFDSVTEADWDRVMAVNAKGPYLFAREAARVMMRQRSGQILNIGGFGDGRVVERPVHYAASKAALRGMTEALALELGRHGIRVHYLEPGLLDVGLGQRLPETRVRDFLSECARGRLGSADEIAELATWLVSDENTFMTGDKIVADGGV